MLKSPISKVIVFATSLCALAVFGSVTASPNQSYEQHSKAATPLINQMPATESDMIQAVYMDF